MTEPKLRLQLISRSFGREVRALDNFSLSVDPGEFVSLLGPSGCGKTTALRIIAGLEKQDSGNVIVDGNEISSLPANKRNMGMVFQQYSLFPNLTAEENISFGLAVRGVSRPKRMSRAKDLLELVGLPTQSKRFPHQLSGGQQQRVALARAIAFEPEILLLDEPLSALDAQVRIQIREEIRRIQIESGITTVFVTHDQEEAMSISDRVAVMNHGHLEQIDRPDVLYRRPESFFVASFVGSSNRIPGIMSGSNHVRILGSEIPVSPHSQHGGKGANVQALIRPEEIHIVKEKTPGSTRAKVALRSFLGPYTTLGLSIPELPLIHVHSESTDNQNLNVGDEVHFVVRAEHVMVTESSPN